MRKIKFRGYRNGHYQYGVGTYEWLGKNYLVCRDKNRIYAVETDEPAAQYIGLDKNGVEVYEGDSFDVKFSNEEATRHYAAELLPQATAENGCIFYDYHFKRNSITKLNEGD